MTRMALTCPDTRYPPHPLVDSAAPAQTLKAALAAVEGGREGGREGRREAYHHYQSSTKLATHRVSRDSLLYLPPPPPRSQAVYCPDTPCPA